MFDLNFIADPGMQNEKSHARWSFLQKQNKPDIPGESDLQQLKSAAIKDNVWKNYVFILIIICLIVLFPILKSRYTQVQPDLIVLNQVIDLIDESGYRKTLQLEEANFSLDQIRVTILSEDFAEIKSLSQGYRMENEIPYEMYQKGKYSYININFPWKGNKKGGDITTLQSIADKIVFSNQTSINQTEDIFEIQGSSSDIISFLLHMVENKQIQKFNFSVFQKNTSQFNLQVKLHLI